MGNACGTRRAADAAEPAARPIREESGQQQSSGNVVEGAPGKPSGHVSSVPPPPVAVCFGGGGFRAFFIGLALARALQAGNLWHKFGYVAASSGGSWISGPFLFDEGFYRRVADLDLAIEDLVNQLFQGYTQASGQVQPPKIGEGLQKLLDKLFSVTNALDSIWAGDDDGPSCLLLNLQQAIEAQYWQTYVQNMLIGWTMDKDFASLSNGINTSVGLNPRKGLPGNATYIVNVSLPPDMWIEDEGVRSAVILPVPSSTDGSIAQLKRLRDAQAAVPVALVKPAGQKGRWLFGDNVSRFDICEHTDPFDISSPLKSIHEFPLPENPSVAALLSMSSSASGAFASPSMLKTIAHSRLPIASEKVIELLESALRLQLYQLVSLAAPLANAGLEDDIKKRPWTVKFRCVDGGYTDQTTVPCTIAQMQRDHPPGTVLRLAVLDNNPLMKTQKYAAAHGLFAGNELYDGAAPGEPAPSYAFSGATNSPSPQVFAQPFPQDGWRVYSDGESNFLASSGSLHIPSQMWEGTLTTVENMSFGVRGGWCVEVVLLVANVGQKIIAPPTDDPSIIHSYQTLAREQLHGLVDKVVPAIHRLMSSAHKKQI